MDWNIDNNKPIYIQLVDKLKSKIISGEIPPGAKLESVRNLAEDAEVNPNTMQKALVELEREELVYSKRTSGRFVTDNEERIKRMREEVANREIENLKLILKELGYSEEEIINLIINNIKGEI
ncbi:MAG: GntR family transcriptional regulator [Sarcina ventriculi]|uniref:HTH-type transcriptional repressor yvoA n=1 Tax=Sarcina ventriculi TaxID=1267 RepID=A0ABP2ASG2_SARVE|nr:GntR family transcriptional regulator [Sarcina ventriculi]MDO4403269.1 GntR family transcriptional regulator [Clostridiaceae bacterium]MBU5322228.1 GntR family transcriptional regulator [Sarcina ventriculi]MCI5637033.1 GntR family transcriptional regulator [Sarcina ventriculi]MDD7372416.1 GntR family transcriptional regulator [Sarcina ventriculi]MDY7061343.1 GntR family transcriptional regulator [Sarcina ventriculi]